MFTIGMNHSKRLRLERRNLKPQSQAAISAKFDSKFTLCIMCFYREEEIIRRRAAATLMRWRYRAGYVCGYSLRALLRLLRLTSTTGRFFPFF